MRSLDWIWVNITPFPLKEYRKRYDDRKEKLKS
jgi:hypothetical protein